MLFYYYFHVIELYFIYCRLVLVDAVVLTLVTFIFNYWFPFELEVQGQCIICIRLDRCWHPLLTFIVQRVDVNSFSYLQFGFLFSEEYWYIFYPFLYRSPFCITCSFSYHTHAHTRTNLLAYTLPLRKTHAHTHCHSDRHTLVHTANSGRHRHKHVLIATQADRQAHSRTHCHSSRQTLAHISKAHTFCLHAHKPQKNQIGSSWFF